MEPQPGSSKVNSPSNSSFECDVSNIQAAALKATKLAVGLPDDIKFSRTIDSKFAEVVDSCSTKVLRLTNGLLETVARDCRASSRVKGKRKLEDLNDVVDSFGSLVVDMLDQLFERAVRGFQVN